MPTEHQKYLQEEYDKYTKERQSKKGPAAQKAKDVRPEEPVIPKEAGFSPRKFGMRRSESNSTVALNDQVIHISVFYINAMFIFAF